MTPIKTKTLILPRLLKISAVILILISGLWYVTFQARYLIAGPQLILMNEPEIVQGERVVRLQGEALNVTALHLNGRAIQTDQEGRFEEAVVLENGYTIVSLDARDRYGRVIHIERPFVYVEGVASLTRERDLTFSN